MSLEDKLLDRYAELIHDRMDLARTLDRMAEEKDTLLCKVRELERKVANLEAHKPIETAVSVIAKENAELALASLTEFLCMHRSGGTDKIALIKLTRILRRQAGLDDGLRPCKDFIDSYM